MSEVKLYECTVLIDASCGVTVEASSPEEAAELAENAAAEQGAGSLCHQCSGHTECGDSYAVIVYGEDGQEVLDTDYRSGQLKAAQSELAALREELAKASEKIDQAWNRSYALDHQGFIPGALDAWKRPVKQHLPYDFSGNPGASATQYCNGWNDCGGYWSGHANELQQRLAAAEQRNVELVDLLSEVIPYEAYLGSKLFKRISAAINPEDLAQDVCTSCDGSGEYIDAIGDWRGYCSCPAGVSLKNKPTESGARE